MDQELGFFKDAEISGWATEWGGWVVLRRFGDRGMEEVRRGRPPPIAVALRRPGWLVGEVLVEECNLSVERLDRGSSW